MGALHGGGLAAGLCSQEVTSPLLAVLSGVTSEDGGEGPVSQRAVALGYTVGGMAAGSWWGGSAGWSRLLAMGGCWLHARAVVQCLAACGCVTSAVGNTLLNLSGAKDPEIDVLAACAGARDRVTSAAHALLLRALAAHRTSSSMTSAGVDAPSSQPGADGGTAISEAAQRLRDRVVATGPVVTRIARLCGPYARGEMQAEGASHGGAVTTWSQPAG